MSIEMFLRIEDPDIEGESDTDGHRGEIDVVAWEWTQSRTGNPAQPGGGGGRVQVEDITIVKRVDAATPRLSLENARGTLFERARLVNRRADTRFDFLIIELDQVSISRLSIDAEREDSALNEVIGLRFSEFVLTYIPQNDDGSAGAPIVGGWNLITNSPAG